MIEESEFHLVLLFYLCLDTQFSSLSNKAYVTPKCCHFTCYYTLPPSLDIELFPLFYLKSRTSRSHMLNLCFNCLFLHTCFSTKQQEVSASLYNRQHDKSLNTKLLCVAFEQCSLVVKEAPIATCLIAPDEFAPSSVSFTCNLHCFPSLDSDCGSQLPCDHLVSPTALAACTRVDSCFAPWFVPSVGMSLQLSQLEIHLCHHLERLGTGTVQRPSMWSHN